MNPAHETQHRAIGIILSQRTARKTKWKETFYGSKHQMNLRDSLAVSKQKRKYTTLKRKKNTHLGASTHQNPMGQPNIMWQQTRQYLGLPHSTISFNTNPHCRVRLTFSPIWQMFKWLFLFWHINDATDFFLAYHFSYQTKLFILLWGVRKNRKLISCEFSTIIVAIPTKGITPPV